MKQVEPLLFLFLGWESYRCLLLCGEASSRGKEKENKSYNTARKRERDPSERKVRRHDEREIETQAKRDKDQRDEEMGLYRREH